jgi:hypothetical protein
VSGSIGRRRFLAGEPIKARPVGRLGRAARWARRRPATAALLAVSVAAVLAVLGVSLTYTELLRRSNKDLRADLGREAVKTTEAEENLIQAKEDLEAGRKDPDLDPIRQREDFLELLAELE